jgi:hypothetical protein
MERNCGIMTVVGASSKSKQNQDGKYGIIMGENQKALALLEVIFVWSWLSRRVAFSRAPSIA